MKQLSYIKPFNQQLLIKVCLLFYLFLAGFNGIGQVYFNQIQGGYSYIDFSSEPPNFKLFDTMHFYNNASNALKKNLDFYSANQRLNENPMRSVSNSKFYIKHKDNLIKSFEFDSFGTVDGSLTQLFAPNDSTLLYFTFETIKPNFIPYIDAYPLPYKIPLYNDINRSKFDKFIIYKINFKPDNKVFKSYERIILGTYNQNQLFKVSYWDKHYHFFTCNFDSLNYLKINEEGQIIHKEGLKYLNEDYDPRLFNFSSDIEISPNQKRIILSSKISGKDTSFFFTQNILIYSVEPELKLIGKTFNYTGTYQNNFPSVYKTFLSPNGKILYVINFNKKDFKVDLTQINLELGSNFLEEIKIGNLSTNTSVSSYLSGPNGKIYIGPYRNGFFDLIKYPNRIGINCGFVNNYSTIDCNKLLSIDPMIRTCADQIQPHQYHGHNLDFQIKLECDSGFTTINLSDSINLNDFKWFIYDNQGGNIYSDSASGRNIHLKTPYPGKFFLKFRCKAPNGFVIWYSDTIDIDYSKVPQPSASFVIHDQKACQFVDFKIFNTGFYPDPDSTSKWTWTFNNWDTSLNSFQDTFHFKFTDTGLFSVNLNYSNNYCSRSFQSNKKIEVLSAPKPAILASSDSICNSSFLKFQNKYASSILKYTVWYNGFGDSLVQNQAVLDSFFYPLAGKFFLKQHLYSDNGCVSIDSIPITVIKGFEPNQKSRLISSSFDDYQLKITWDSIPFANAYHLWNGSQPQVLNKLIYSGNSFNHSFDFFEPFPIQYFRLKVMDACKNELASNPSNSLALKHNFSDLGLIISWNSYDSFFNNLKYYQLLSSIDGINFQNIQQTQNLEYLDLSFFQKNNDSIAYKIIAHGNDSLEIAHSPILWVRSPFSIFIPNAFSPNQDLHNPHFMPISTGVLSQNYQLRIYNRWGEEIFVSNNKNQAWDGKNLKNQPAPEGVYFYTLQFSYLDPQNIIRRSLLKGQVTLIR